MEDHVGLPDPFQGQGAHPRLERVFRIEESGQIVKDKLDVTLGAQSR
jgi:hypothetical protein